MSKPLIQKMNMSAGFPNIQYVCDYDGILHAVRCPRGVGVAGV